jgi:hypothetical protein
MKNQKQGNGDNKNYKYAFGEVKDMLRLADAMERIKALECPTGDVAHRVIEILEEYEVANKKDITVNKGEKLDENGLEVYRAVIGNIADQPIVVIVKPGADDYVAKVIDVHIG